MIKADTIEFMRKLDVKEIHGYDATLGLKLISPAVLDGTSKPETREGEGGRPRRPALASATDTVRSETRKRSTS